MKAMIGVYSLKAFDVKRSLKMKAMIGVYSLKAFDVKRSLMLFLLFHIFATLLPNESNDWCVQS